MGPLALFAHDAGYEVCGSDLSKGAIYNELVKAGIEVSI
jgi:UDP-N-acetylmuramate-alanine ligase